MEDKKKMNRIIVILILIFLVLTWIFLKIYNLSAIQFCDSGTNPLKNNNCKPCPKNGLCENGQLTCDVMYVRDGDNCIESSKLLQLKDKTLEGIIEDLERNNGDLQCSQLSNENQIVYKSIKEIKLILDKIPQFSETLIKDLYDPENQERFDYEINKNGMIYTKNSRKSLICHIKIYFYQNPFRSFGLTIFTIISILTMYKIRRIQIERKISYEIFDFLVTDLKKSQDNTLNIAKYDYEWKKKYKSDFNENVLHNVEKLRQQVKQIEVFFDENDTLWYLNQDAGNSTYCYLDLDYRPQCRKCPENAECSNGEILCDYGYKLETHGLQDRLCVKKDRLEMEAEKLFLNILIQEEYLQGQHVCRQEQEYVQKQLSLQGIQYATGQLLINSQRYTKDEIQIILENMRDFASSQSVQSNKNQEILLEPEFKFLEEIYGNKLNNKIIDLVCEIALIKDNSIEIWEENGNLKWILNKN
ncbi:hypothetical protein PPERSA_08223 [Pseudocohnilembus persalinus]|uniref:Man1/Src1 C-terminal domain-containing protein n=1 Tax=Pseudocohnilembus persalinus TaxID=266149 RepID=A0A0V0QFY2_PSEPJ|nr:hypothetical protein PPERSA_08223 [Pseudocohnilembus persalinus]|eukprot:KRX01122.1 hypothetical protein PPERSA_08223 [Pseudocohnilembus persalinus]